MILVANMQPQYSKSHSQQWLFCRFPLLVPLFLLLFLQGCSGELPQVSLQGSTMGTSWTVTYVEGPDFPDDLEAEAVQLVIQARLDEINASMSTYLDDSDISLFNNLPVGQWYSMSYDFQSVLLAALEVGEASHGAYDVTIGPLVNLWGFGPGTLTSEPPDKSKIDAGLQNVGQELLSVSGTGSSVRKSRDVKLDFSSLAKGYAVDEVARSLKALGIRSFLVEVGGEMKLSGVSARGDKWRVGVEEPSVSGGRQVATAISLTNNAVATSGDYRNYFEYEGKRYSHSIDPRTGYPVAHDLVSVTVVHKSAMLADAWATALTVLGYERAMVLANKSDLAVYFIRRSGDNYLHSHTDPFSAYLEQASAGGQAASTEDGR
jgi:FAD:protein FMN transferase